MKKISIKEIITHPGRAHRDDFLGCCVALAAADGEVTIRRTDHISEKQIEDPEVWVLDIGGEHDPERGLFDHHQFEKQAPPACSLSLVLRKLGIYDQALEALPWLAALEVWDSKGPVGLGHFLDANYLEDAPEGVRGQIKKLRGKTWERMLVPMLSPIDMFVLTEFQQLGEIVPGFALWHLMHDLGQAILEEVEHFAGALEFLLEHGRVINVKGLDVLISPENTPMIRNVSVVVDAWRARVAPNAAVSISPDERASGYSLFRFDNHERVNFRVLEGRKNIKFTHVTGFIAKTTVKDLDEAIAFVTESISEEIE
jgi:hypothetical protein